MATVLLLGLDDLSAETLAKFLVHAGHVSQREPLRITWETRPAENIIFLSGDQKGYRDALESLRRFHNAPFIVVISRLGDTRGWIDALEAGASDFLTAPYTQTQVSGVMQAALSRSKGFAA